MTRRVLIAAMNIRAGRSGKHVLINATSPRGHDWILYYTVVCNIYTIRVRSLPLSPHAEMYTPRKCIRHSTQEAPHPHQAPSAASRHCTTSFYNNQNNHATFLRRLRVFPAVFSTFRASYTCRYVIYHSPRMIKAFCRPVKHLIRHASASCYLTRYYTRAASIESYLSRVLVPWWCNRVADWGERATQHERERKVCTSNEIIHYTEKPVQLDQILWVRNLTQQRNSVNLSASQEMFTCLNLRNLIAEDSVDSAERVSSGFHFWRAFERLFKNKATSESIFRPIFVIDCIFMVSFYARDLLSRITERRSSSTNSQLIVLK